MPYDFNSHSTGKYVVDCHNAGFNPCGAFIKPQREILKANFSSKAFFTSRPQTSLEAKHSKGAATDAVEAFHLFSALLEEF